MRRMRLTQRARQHNQWNQRKQSQKQIRHGVAEVIDRESGTELP